MSTVSTAGSYVDSSMVNSSAKTNEASGTKKSKVTGKTIGNPELSEKASKYYEELKKKYSNMDFILVSKEEKEAAQAQAGRYANANRMVVLIDEEKIERMAEDENYRKQYEGIIENAASGLSQLQSSLANSSANVKAYGMKVNDNGTASYFAVIDKSLEAQKQRIEKKAEDKKEAKKAEDKKEKKAKEEERLEKRRADSKNSDKIDSETTTVTASSIEELIKKINDSVYSSMSDNVQTEEELQLGRHIDFKM